MIQIRRIPCCGNHSIPSLQSRGSNFAAEASGAARDEPDFGGSHFSSLFLFIASSPFNKGGNTLQLGDAFVMSCHDEIRAD